MKPVAIFRLETFGDTVREKGAVVTVACGWHGRYARWNRLPELVFSVKFLHDRERRRLCEGTIL